MTKTNGRTSARCRNAIVTAAIAIVVLCGGRASAWAAGKGMPAPPAVSASTATIESGTNRGTPAATAASPMTDSYADRETSARDLQKFKGGDVVIVGTTGVIVALLVVIILLSL
jgi:hypothetical protein